MSEKPIFGDLEKDIDFWFCSDHIKGVARELLSDNKGYREALKEIMEVREHDHPNHVDIARQALAKES